MPTDEANRFFSVGKGEIAVGIGKEYLAPADRHAQKIAETLLDLL